MQRQQAYLRTVAMGHNQLMILGDLAQANCRRPCVIPLIFKTHFLAPTQQCIAAERDDYAHYRLQNTQRKADWVPPENRRAATGVNPSRRWSNSVADGGHQQRLDGMHPVFGLFELNGGG